MTRDGLELNTGDLVCRKNDIYREGIVLEQCEKKQDHYFVVFFVGTQYLCQPSVELYHKDDLVVLKKQIHKEPPPPKFKKIKKRYY